MKATELRIGNLVNRVGVSDNKDQVSVHSLNALGFITVFISTYSISCSENQIEPIQLTEEWLLKFGFVKQENDMWYLMEFETDHTKGSFGVNHITGSIQIGNDVYTQAMKSCKYVHQLQNLYFALTGTEL